MYALNPLLVDTGTPPVPEVKAWAAGYAGAQGPMIDLSQAVPGYPPHPAMLARLSEEAGRAGNASYGPILGDAELREAYAAHVSAMSGGTVRAAETAITMGCNQAFIVAMQALLQAGDAVLLPCPWYFNHQMTLQMMGVEARPLPCSPENGFVPDPDEAERLLEGRVKAIVLVTPNNPTGAVYPPEVVARFAELCRRRHIALVVDETYRDFLPTEAGVGHDLYSDPDWRDVLIGLYSFSKSYCIPGQRLGAIVASQATLSEIGKVLDCFQICPSRPGQQALVPMIGALAGWRDGNRREIEARGRAFRAAMAGAQDWRVDSVGAYFAFVAHPLQGMGSPEVARTLAEERGVVVLPATYFGPGQETHLRFAFANATSDALAQLPERLRGFGA
jgi:aspartate/methionine/tyrosine aminotransferase